MYKTLELSSDIKMIVSDFDGIFTNNKVIFLDMNTRLKELSFKDLMGVSVAVKNGIKVAIVSGEKSKEIDYIAEKFSLEDVHQGIRNKLSIYESIKAKYGFSDDEILYVGDDINDIECMKRAKYAVTVNQANYKVKELEHVQIVRADAGDGAFREIVDNVIDLRHQNDNER